MYAETFNVRPWLEEPAKWLRWAMQSLGARNLTDVRYNLQQFWTTLAGVKGKASSQQDWSEILTMDAQSQWTLGRLYESEASDVLKQINTAAQLRNLTMFTDPISAASALFGVQDPVLSGLQKTLDGYNKAAKAAYDQQVSLAAQAASAAAAAGVQSQAQATLTVGQNAQRGAGNTASFVDAQASSMVKPPNLLDELKNTLSTPLLGVPMWAWFAGGLALVLLISTAPAAAEAAAIRRAVED
ncbi:MAG TPA: hypothetical protein VF768_11765 [Holophagaceae bacterium]